MAKMECPKSSWYKAKRFASFWEHYNLVMRTAHQHAVVRAEIVAAQTKAALTLNSMQSGPSLGKRGKSKSKKHRKNKKRKLRNQLGNQSDTESLHSQMSQGMHIQDTTEDMDVTEDFLKFLEQSKRHREEWKVTKFQNNTTQDTIKTEKMAPDSGPKEHPDVIRTREMQQLYGEAAPKLQAMETALQLSFDRNSTLHQLEYWPNIPLNIMFNDN